MHRLIALSDFHCGHRKGLLAPNTLIRELDQQESWHPELSEVNKDLWNLLQRLLETADACSYPTHLIFLGDAFWGVKHPDGLIDRSEFAQISVAKQVFHEIYQLHNLCNVELIAGTDAHEFEGNSALRTLIGELQIDYPEVHTDGCYHALLNVDGLVVDATHHGPHPGSRIWLEGNVATYHLRDKVYRHLNHGERSPDIFLRAHYHTQVSVILDIGGKEYRLMILPSYLGMTGFARRVTHSEHILTNGGLILDIEAGNVRKVQWITRSIDLRTTRIWN